MKWATHIAPPATIIDHAKPPMTFNKICPAIMFANNRTDKLMKVIVNPMTSSGTMNPTIANGVPAGRNLRKKANPCNRKPMINFPIQIAKAKVIVTTK